VTIPLDPELDPVANAQVHFDRAKRAKARRDWVLQQHEHHISERNDLLAMLETLETADANALEASESEAERRRWLFLQKAPVAAEERPYGGRRIRELLGPSGWTILLGENAEANDYLTLRVAKPDDWWLHVRGAVSAHAVVPTRRQPYRVPRQVLEFAALMVARNSGQKHASYVPVDYTLKRYVRKVRGAPPGTVLYTHEKTLFVDPVKSN
jgi:predicted ribosome quality control (RQC) complex YloA/Tae2 family protein